MTARPTPKAPGPAGPGSTSPATMTSRASSTARAEAGDESRGRLRLLLADDHTLLLEALTVLLQPAGEVVGVATDGQQLLSLMDALRPDLVITDLSMPGLSGFDVLRAIRARPNPPPVLVLTVHTDVGTARATMAAGAAGYVVKSAASLELLDAIAAVWRGETYVSPPLWQALTRTPRTAAEQLSVRQRAVLEGMAAGRSDKQIAALLGISKRTVTFHKEQLRSRLGVHTAVEMLELLRRVRGEPELGDEVESTRPKAS